MIKAEIRINRTLPTELIKLMNKCGERKRSPKTVIKALRDGLFMVGLYVNGELGARAVLNVMSPDEEFVKKALSE